MKEWATPGRPKRARSRTPAISPQDKRLSDDRMVPCPIATENRGSRKRQRTESRIIQLSASPQIETPDNTIVAEDVAKGDSEEQENDARAMHQREDEEEFRLWRQDKSVSVFRRQSQPKHPYLFSRISLLEELLSVDMSNSPSSSLSSSSSSSSSSLLSSSSSSSSSLSSLSSSASSSSSSSSSSSDSSPAEGERGKTKFTTCIGGGNADSPIHFPILY